ncbi:hypothetical protein, partial [Sphingomonas oligophenolica]
HHIHPGHFSMKIPGQLSAEINSPGVGVTPVSANAVDREDRSVALRHDRQHRTPSRAVST